ncbi:MAG: TIR domain-containing protein [Desulfobacterales bacterium]|nr:MAG: TIR domain-containing protein [Desulfobacterales bacterium]
MENTKTSSKSLTGIFQRTKGSIRRVLSHHFGQADDERVRKAAEYAQGRQASIRSSSMKYKAFISYSHAADGKLAPELERGLKRFAKPWYRLRAMRVFRDQTGLALTPELWPTILKALEDSENFVVLASPKAAESRWVRKEIEHWHANRDPRRMYIVLTDGELQWDNEAHDYDWSKTTSLPALLAGTFREEPLHLDLRWAKRKNHLSLREPHFRDAIAELAAPLHGKDKDEISGEDVRQHRRTVKVVVATVILLASLAVWATIQAVIAEQRRQTAQSRQLAAQALSRLGREELDSALLLSVEANRVKATQEARKSLLAGLITFPHFVRHLRGHANEVEGLAYSPDGKTFASASKDGTIVRWDAKTGNQVGEALNSGGHILTSLALSPDGETLAVGDQDGTVRYARLSENGSKMESVRACEVVWSIEFLGDNETIAAVCRYRGVTSWRVGSPKVRRLELPGDWDTVGAATFSADGSVVAASGIGGVIAVDLSPRPKLNPAKLDSRGDEILALDGAGSRFAVAHRQTVEIWDRQLNKRRFILEAPRRAMFSALSFSLDGKLLAAGTEDREIILWSLARTPRIESTLRGHRGRISSLRFSADGKALVSGDASGLIVQWDLTKPYRIMEQLGISSAKDSALTFSGDGQSLAWLDDSGVLQRWHLRERKFEPPIPADKSRQIQSFAFQPGKKVVVLGLDDGSIQRWDLEHHSKTGPSIPAHADAVTWIAFAPDGEIFASSGCAGFKTVTGHGTEHRLCADYEIRTWRASDGTEVGAAQPKSIAAQTSFAARGDWSMVDETQALPLESIESSARVVHPKDQVLIAAGCGDFDGTCRTGIIRFWNLTTATAEGPSLFGHETGIRRIALSPDGQILATGDQDGAIMLWDVGTRESLAPPMKGHHRSISGLSFSSDGNLLVSASEDDVVVWDLHPQSLVSHACDTANRQFDEMEWRLRFDEPYRATCGDSGS